MGVIKSPLRIKLVDGIDNQGCGRSEGLRAYVSNFDDFVDDVVQSVR